MTPSTFKPQAVEDFIGETGRLARILTAKLNRIKEDPKAKIKWMFFGAPGVAKTDLAWMLLNMVAGHVTDIIKVNGQSFTVDAVREWHKGRFYRPVSRGWSCFLVNEIDSASPEALSQALELWDDMMPQTAFIATSNAELANSTMAPVELKKAIPARVHSRFIPYRFTPIRPDEIAMFLFQRWQFPFEQGLKIAKANNGDVRACLNDCERELDSMEVAA